MSENAEMSKIARASAATNHLTESNGSSSEADKIPTLQDSVATTSLPRYAMPNVSSMLPEYGNLEQDLIGRAFNAANYDAIARLPADIDHSTVAGARRMAIEAARTAAAAPHDGTRNARRNGLFSEFEYSQSEYDLYNQLENKAREEHKAIMATISGTEFKLPGSICKGKYQDGFQEGGLYPYLSDPYEAAHEMALRLKWISQAQMLSGPWSNPGHDKLGDRPSRHLAGEIMAHLRKLIVEVDCRRRHSVGYVRGCSQGGGQDCQDCAPLPFIHSLQQRPILLLAGDGQRELGFTDLELGERDLSGCRGVSVAWARVWQQERRSREAGSMCQEGQEGG